MRADKVEAILEDVLVRCPEKHDFLRQVGKKLVWRPSNTYIRKWRVHHLWYTHDDTTDIMVASINKTQDYGMVEVHIARGLHPSDCTYRLMDVFSKYEYFGKNIADAKSAAETSVLMNFAYSYDPSEANVA